MIRYVFATFLFLASVNVKAETTIVKLPTAADGEIGFPIDTIGKLPLGAADDKAQVVSAGFTLLANQKDQPLITFSWVYEIKFSDGNAVKSIAVEDEAGAVLVPLIRDENPKIENGIWRGMEKLEGLTQNKIDSMQSKEAWILIRRITIIYGDNSQSKLHQLVVSTRQTRMSLLDNLMTKMKAKTP